MLVMKQYQGQLLLQCPVLRQMSCTPVVPSVVSGTLPLHCPVLWPVHLQCPVLCPLLYTPAVPSVTTSTPAMPSAVSGTPVVPSFVSSTLAVTSAVTSSPCSPPLTSTRSLWLIAKVSVLSPYSSRFFPSLTISYVNCRSALLCRTSLNSWLLVSVLLNCNIKPEDKWLRMPLH